MERRKNGRWRDELVVQGERELGILDKWILVWVELV